MKRISLFIILLIAFQSINAQETHYKRNYPNIAIFMDNHPDITILYEEYMDALEDSSAYTSIQEFDMVFEKRDSFIVALNKSQELITVLENWDNEEIAEYPALNSENFRTEIESIGVTANFSEGMMFGISTAPIMMSCIKKQCDRDYYLYVYIRDNYSYTLNGEYPYTNLEIYLKVILASEELFKNYPKSNYLAETYQNFYYCLYPYIDIHISQSGEYKNYIVGGYNSDFWPGATSIEYHQKFLVEQQNSIFYSSLSRIINNMSEITPDAEQIYYIEVPFIEEENIFSKCVPEIEDYFIEYEDAKFSWMTYLWNGIDIAHILHIPTAENPNEYHYILAYRFFEDKTKAEESLKEIKKKVPKAVLKTVEIKTERYD